MSHALIIDDNVVLSRAIRSRLEAFGYNSFDCTWAEQQALAAAASRSPDLIVVGDTIAEGSPLGVAGRLGASKSVPVLMVTNTQTFMLQRNAPDGTVIDGPYRLSELDMALATIRPTA